MMSDTEAVLFAALKELYSCYVDRGKATTPYHIDAIYEIIETVSSGGDLSFYKEILDDFTE